MKKLAWYDLNSWLLLWNSVSVKILDGTPFELWRKYPKIEKKEYVKNDTASLEVEAPL